MSTPPIIPMQETPKARHPMAEVFAAITPPLRASSYSASSSSPPYLVRLSTASIRFCSPPSSAPGVDGFLLGTDYLGRDLMAALIHGARVSIVIGVAAAFMSVFIGVTVGALAGFYRGWVEELLMRITEFFQVLPTLLFAMVIVALFGASLPMITFAIGVVSWTAVARITRSEFLRIRELEYVTASRASGAKNGKLMFQIILPNALPPIIVQAALMVGSAILFEAGLSFLGLTDPNVVSWGQIIGSNRQYILDAGYTVTIPGVAIFITVLCISLVGDGLNDALNPKLKER